MIIFDVDSVRLKSVVETNPKVVDKLNQKYNAERIRKEIKAETVGLVSQYLGKSFNECQSYLDNRMRDYLET